jgi:hypothetical protein
MDHRDTTIDPSMKDRIIDYGILNTSHERSPYILLGFYYFLNYGRNVYEYGTLFRRLQKFWDKK